MKVLQKTWISLNDLQEQEKQMFLDHYKNKENVFILYNNIGNVEYKIIKIDSEKIYLEFNNKIVR